MRLPSPSPKLVSRLLVAASLVGLASLGPRPAAASCIEQPPIEDAVADPQRIVFVGTVIRTLDQDTEALFHVEEIWSGPALPEWLWVDGSSASDPGPFEPVNPTSSVDTSFQSGVRYLAFPHDLVWPDGSELQRFGSVGDSTCSLTQPWSPELAAFRPDRVRSPFANAAPSAGFPIELLGVGAAVALVAALSLVALRASRRRA